ncbi:unnamed protein product [Cuscuta campestris]|uniref:Uncharacterized protein n=1 Tax=Cuscuta campestris TaxID=132261 RepID=A0A484LIU6_9ASTE|nr:unnamed protein product [Cuscuta campestris]
MFEFRDNSFSHVLRSGNSFIAHRKQFTHPREKPSSSTAQTQSPSPAGFISSMHFSGDGTEDPELETTHFPPSGEFKDGSVASSFSFWE